MSFHYVRIEGLKVSLPRVCACCTTGLSGEPKDAPSAPVIDVRQPFNVPMCTACRRHVRIAGKWLFRSGIAWSFAIALLLGSAFLVYEGSLSPTSFWSALPIAAVAVWFWRVSRTRGRGGADCAHDPCLMLMRTEGRKVIRFEFASGAYASQFLDANRGRVA